MDHIEDSEGDLKKQISSAGDKELEEVQISTQGTKEDNCYLDEKHTDIVSDKTFQEIPQLHHEFNPEHLSRSDENIFDRYFLYINRDEEGRPPVPLQTYRWEDLRRAQQQGGYPWTHLYKRPLGPGEEPEILVKYKIRDISFGNASPQAEKKFSNYENENNIDLGTSIEKHKECDKQEIAKLETLDSIDNHNIEQTHLQKDCTFPKGILKVRRKKPKDKLKFVTTPASPSLPDNSPRNSACCNPLVDKIKTMADKQLSKHHIKKIPLRSDEHIILEEQKILQLETSPEADRRKIPHFVEKQDSDDVVEILELEESPRKIRKKLGFMQTENEYESILVPDEVIEIPVTYKGHDKVKTTDSDKIPTDTDADQVTPEEVQVDKDDHFYEDIKSVVEESIDQILEDATLNALKKSLAQQDSETLKVLNEKSILLEELGSSEEDSTKLKNELAPISSIDSASSDEVKQISTLGTIEENDSTDEHTIPNTSDKKDSFSNRNGSKENHEEDILLDDFMNERRWSKMR